MARFAKIHFLNAVLLFFISKNVVADLPIHATLRDMVGGWRFTVSKQVTGPNVNCGSDLPNTLEGDLALGDYLNFLTKNYGTDHTLDLELTLDPVKYNNVSGASNREEWVALAVKQNGNVKGTWTALYDQGFQLDLYNDLNLLLFFSFHKIEDKRYATDTNKSLIGWATKNDRGTMYHFCVYGEKTNPSSDQTLNTVDLTETSFERFKREFIRVANNGKLTFHPATDDPWNGYKNNYFCSCDPNVSNADLSNLPKSFTWERFDNIPIKDQKSCGGCYAIATSYMLQARSLIKVNRLLEHSKDARLLDLQRALTEKTVNVNYALSCIPFNQGCKGGYPLSTGKFAKEYGLVLDDDSTEEVRDNLKCDANEDPNTMRLFANDYGYVSGCYQCTHCNGEVLIMREIMENGPVAAGIDGAYIRHFKDGVVNPTAAELAKHHGLCEFPNNKFLSGFEYTTHAITLMGWGEDANGFKYWNARNSWGNSWGDKGYFKIVRGVNAFGLESEAVYVDPDINRFLQNTNEQPIHKHNVN